MTSALQDVMHDVAQLLDEAALDNESSEEWGLENESCDDDALPGLGGPLDDDALSGIGGLLDDTAALVRAACPAEGWPAGSCSIVLEGHTVYIAEGSLCWRLDPAPALAAVPPHQAVVYNLALGEAGVMDELHARFLFGAKDVTPEERALLPESIIDRHIPGTKFPRIEPEHLALDPSPPSPGDSTDPGSPASSRGESNDDDDELQDDDDELQGDDERLVLYSADGKAKAPATAVLHGVQGDDGWAATVKCAVNGEGYTLQCLLYDDYTIRVDDTAGQEFNCFELGFWRPVASKQSRLILPTEAFLRRECMDSMRLIKAFSRQTGNDFVEERRNAKDHRPVKVADLDALDDLLAGARRASTLVKHCGYINLEKLRSDMTRLANRVKRASEEMHSQQKSLNTAKMRSCFCMQDKEDGGYTVASFLGRRNGPETCLVLFRDFDNEDGTPGEVYCAWLRLHDIGQVETFELIATPHEVEALHGFRCPFDSWYGGVSTETWEQYPVPEYTAVHALVGTQVKLDGDKKPSLVLWSAGNRCVVERPDGTQDTFTPYLPSGVAAPGWASADKY